MSQQQKTKTTTKADQTVEPVKGEKVDAEALKAELEKLLDELDTVMAANEADMDKLARLAESTEALALYDTLMDLGTEHQLGLPAAGQTYEPEPEPELMLVLETPWGYAAFLKSWANRQWRLDEGAQERECSPCCGAYLDCPLRRR